MPDFDFFLGFLLGVEQLLELFDGQVEDGASVKEFDVNLLFYGESLASLAVVGVLVRGFVSDRLARREMEHRSQGFSDSVIRWVILTFPRYQCNGSSVRE